MPSPTVVLASSAQQMARPLPEALVAESGRLLQRNPTIRCRRVVVVVAVLVGAALIGATLRLPRGSASFYVAGYLLAGVWILASVLGGPVRMRGPLMLRSNELVIGIALGAVMFALFVPAAEIGRNFTVLAGPIDNVLGKADAGPVVAVLALALVNGLAEELFFRGALNDAITGRWALIASTVVYVGVTAVAGNIALTLAAVVMGAVFAAERRITAGLVAPIVTHLLWSTLIVVALPR